MDDYDYTPFEDEPAPRKPRPTGFRLPGGLSLQAAAAILLVAVSLAALYLIFGPTPEEGEVVAPATNTPAAPLAAASGTPPAATAASASRTAGTPSAATPAAGATALAGAPTAPLAAAAAPTALAPMSGLATSPASGSAPAGGPLAVDGFARVAGTDTFGLRLRFGAGLDTATIRWADEGEVLRVVGGPLTEDGETWWRVQDALGNTGWAAATYLSPAAPPPAWAPPIASPTFDASAAGLEDPSGGEGATESGAGEDGSTAP